MSTDSAITEPPAKEEFPAALPKLDMDLFKVWQGAFERIGGIDALVEWAKDDKNKKKFFEMGVSLQPKNIKVEQEHKIRFVEVPMKVGRPELRKGSDVIDTHGVEVSTSRLAKAGADTPNKNMGRKWTEKGKAKKLKRDKRLSADRKVEGKDGFNG